MSMKVNAITSEEGNLKQVFLSVKDGSMTVVDTPAPTVKDNTVIVETLYSVVSAGTERSLTSFGGKNLILKDPIR